MATILSRVAVPSLLIVGIIGPGLAQPRTALASGSDGLVNERQGMVRLWIDGDDDRIQLRRPASNVVTLGVELRFDQILCRTPCGISVDGRLGQEFYFGGPSLTPSTSFTFLDHSGDVTARVRAGSSFVRGLGAGFAIVGGGVGLVSALALLSDTSSSAVFVASAGLVTLITGIVMLTLSGTSYEFSEGPPKAADSGISG